ncbi:phosphoenolpyruvate synthase regulatory protein [Rhodothalassium salexigens]|uniref:pyruvate, water dikinase regulatory protein n=1 Tax=Rhodothalassium salexigens TaxID=1086 RepID=UPI001914BFDE|nr:pyruvate, water dikinase regulatory protein [Rhodothalassium salexigens]MBK5921349.1 phosphoenolpyruvate synthase regulatory protein [Rhodothalassium salexigens]
MNTAKTVQHIHLISDATGETLESMAKAALAQFDTGEVRKHIWPMIRSPQQMDRVMNDIERRPGLVLYTLVNEQIRDVLVRRSSAAGLKHVSVLDPVISALASYLGQEATHLPGRQHMMDAQYFDRIEAMHYTMAHDDGQMPDGLAAAQIILVGVSRTSKTPTAIYLANRGFRVANVPFVLNARMPEERMAKANALVVGLTTSPERLVQIRTSRLRSIQEQSQTDYTDLETVREEVRLCRRYCNERGYPVIDVSRKSIEEAAAAIINLYHERKGPCGNGAGAK